MERFSPDSSTVTRICPSPNFNERRSGEAGRVRGPDMLVLHYTGVHPDAEAAWVKEPGRCALEWLCNPDAQVSAHYLVELNGEIFQLVPEELRAWHAGASSWKGEGDLNSASIGIEIVNLGHDHGLPYFPQIQIDAVIALCSDIVRRHGIAPERVLAHSDIAPERKADPGEKFPWNQLYAKGVGRWVPPVAVSQAGPLLASGAKGMGVLELRRQLADYGYALPVTDVYDGLCEAVVLAFQRHFRPEKCDGIADASTRETLRELLGIPAKRPVS
jgi:N-acetylmuramoyl-L-alanine amidase